MVLTTLLAQGSVPIDVEFGFAGLRAPVAELDGEQVGLRRTRLTDPGGGARRAECGDGPIWVEASEPLDETLATG